ncbi:MAG: hydrogenase [Lentisphaerae bacterium GWF2_44_16]|nr:MAG: hydrogenase [Lentisphaerae bacterium GWF2_44_16]
MNWYILINIILPFVLAPFLFGVINRTKAFFAGRRGQPLLQLYYDLFKLFRKGSVYSVTTTWIFRIAPFAVFSSIVCVILIMPCGALVSPIGFRGDILLFIYFLAMARFFTVAAALDTGSSFEGMGASREVQFAALTEPAFILCMAALACETHSFSLSTIFSRLSFASWSGEGAVLLLVAVSLMIVLLAENSRVPVDDPNTHLELTMIHEVMVLDYSGPDLGFILYGAALKLWIIGSLVVGVALPVNTGNFFLDRFIFLGGMVLLAVIIGIIESVMARFRFLKIPQVLILASALSILALILQVRF